MQKSHWRIAKGMAWVTLFVFIAKLVGAAKEMAIAYRYGVNEIVDSYVLAFTVVTWLPAVWHSVLEVVLVPLFVQLAQREKRVFFAELTGFTLFVGVILALLFVVIMPYVIPYIFTDNEGKVNDYATYFAMGLAPVAFAGMLVGTFFTRLLAEERHANTMMEMLPSLFILLAVLAWPMDPFLNLHPEPLLYGTLLGFIMYVCGLWYLLSRAQITIRPRWKMQSPAWKMMWQGFGYLLLGQFIMSVANPIDLLMVAQLGEGAIATLNYANKVLALILGLGATAVARAILPVLSSEIVTNAQNAWHLTRRWSQLLIILGLCGVIIVWMLAPLLIKVLFERGEFTSHNAQSVVEVFRYGLLQVPFYVSGIVFTRYLASNNKYKLIAITSIVIIIIKIPANYFLIRFYGVPGVTLSTSLIYFSSWIMCFAFCLWVVKKKSEMEKNKVNIKTFGEQ